MEIKTRDAYESFAIKLVFRVHLADELPHGVEAAEAFVRLLTSNYDHQGCDYNTVLLRMAQKNERAGNRLIISSHRSGGTFFIGTAALSSRAPPVYPYGRACSDRHEIKIRRGRHNEQEVSRYEGEKERKNIALAIRRVLQEQCCIKYNGLVVF